MLDLAVDYIKDLQKQAQVIQKATSEPCQYLKIDYYLNNFVSTHDMFL